MDRSPHRLTLLEIEGTPLAAGVEYGKRLETELMGFCRLGVTPNKQRLRYAKRCWPHVEKSAPTSAAFMRGIARGSGLSLEHVTLLTLHEEIYHQPHCTAFAATGDATRGGKTIVGQNWDWAPDLFPWAGLLRLCMKGHLNRATYHYPGLWSSAGINEAGLCLMWTGGGYFPQVAPIVGVPTYVLISEILELRTVAEALDYLGNIQQAGSFIFFLGDATGDTAIVEAVPRKRTIERAPQLGCRANHYTSNAVLQSGKQKRPSRATANTLQRAEMMDDLTGKHRGRMTPEIGRKILTDRTGDWPWLHQFPGGRKAHELGGMTIDSLLAVCEDRELWTCRGGRNPGPWQCVKP